MSAAENLNQLYEQQIKPLGRADRLQLLARIAQDLAVADDDDQPLNLLDLEGLGEEVWRGIDAQAYVNELRDEWDRP